MNEEVIKNNTTVLLGTVASDFTLSHEVYSEGFYTFNLEVSRLSQTSDILPITISERLLDEALKIGTKVKIVGQVRSYNNFNEATRRNKLILTLFARDIEILDELPTNNPNDIFLNGYLCKPPIYRVTPFGREIADILIAVNRSYNKSDYIPCIAWGRNARFAGKLAVGNNVKIWGRMQSRDYQKTLDTGEVQEKTAYEISVSKLELVQEPSLD